MACLRERESGEILDRIEYALKEQFRLNWGRGAPPAMFIYGDSPDRDERSQGSLVIGIASSNAEDKFGLPVGFLSEVVETRIRTGGAGSAARIGARDSERGLFDRCSNLLPVWRFPTFYRGQRKRGEKMKVEVFELFEALQNFAKDHPVGADKVLLDIDIEGQDVVRVPIPRSAAAAFAAISGITGIPVQDLYTAMIVSSADAFCSTLSTHTKQGVEH